MTDKSNSRESSIGRGRPVKAVALGLMAIATATMLLGCDFVASYVADGARNPNAVISKDRRSICATKSDVKVSIGGSFSSVGNVTFLLDLLNQSGGAVAIDVEKSFIKGSNGKTFLLKQAHLTGSGKAGVRERVELEMFWSKKTRTLSTKDLRALQSPCAHIVVSCDGGETLVFDFCFSGFKR